MTPSTSSPPLLSSSRERLPRHTADRGPARRRTRPAAPVSRSTTAETLDAFGDARPRRPSRTWAWPRPTVVQTLTGAAITVDALALTLRHPLPLVALLAIAVVAGAWLSGRMLWRWLSAIALLVGVAATWVSPPSSSAVQAMLHGVFGACLVLGFGMLPRALVGRAIDAARRAERARADAEVLRLIEEARLFRRLGRSAEHDDARSVQNDVSVTLAQHDRLYRLVRLVEQGISDTAVTALYVLDDAGRALLLVEQAARTDVDGALDAVNHARLPLGERGTGAAGVVGLCLQRRTPLRVVDAQGAAVRAHREAGPAPRSVLAVPLLSAGGTARGVLVVDRLSEQPFSDHDEAFARALAAEVVDGLTTERLVEDLAAARRRIARVYAATRALTGVTRTDDVVEQALSAVGGLCAGVALVQTSRVGAPARVLGACGPLASLAGFSAVVGDDSFGARALVEHTPLPHTSLDQAVRRPLLAAHEPLTLDDVGDLRAVPLCAHGEALGLLLVAVAPGDRLRADVVDAVVAVADVLALALLSAAAFDDVEREATTDGLTGVFNRRTLDRRLDEAVARARRTQQPLCVVLTDVDHFKSVNDTWGHATGDDVLKGVAATLTACARTTDVVGRLGGEEFVVVCEGTDLAGALVLADRMRVALKARRFDTPRGPLSVTSSFGVALLTVDDTGHAVLERADQQLYRAKQQGRDRVVGA